MRGSFNGKTPSFQVGFESSILSPRTILKGPVAQRKSGRLIIVRSRYRNPPGPPGINKSNIQGTYYANL